MTGKGAVQAGADCDQADQPSGIEHECGIKCGRVEAILCCSLS